MINFARKHLDKVSAWRNPYALIREKSVAYRIFRISIKSRESGFDMIHLPDRVEVQTAVKLISYFREEG